MDLLDLLKKRYSVRSYNAHPVEQEKLDKIIEAAHVAPTAGNRQPVRLFIVRDKEKLGKVQLAANIFGAPLVIIACSDSEKAWQRSFDGMITSDIDAAILTDHMMIEATNLGLGSLWICKFDPVILMRELEIPSHLTPVNILALGYTDDSPAPSNRHAEKRIPIDELVTYL